jgi:hypothetical protein
MYARKNLNILRAVLTLLSTFRVMDAKLNLKIETITSPFSGISQTLPNDEVFLALKRLLGNNRFSLEQAKEIPFAQERRLLCITKAGPNGKVSMKNSIIDAYAILKNPHIYSNLIKLSKTTAPYLSKLLLNEVTTIRAILDYPQERWERIQPYMAGVFSYLRFLNSQSNFLKLGKLSTKVEAAGKVRVFAMVDLWTQSILDPLHKEIFRILKTFPTDGTFNQLKPLDHFNTLPHGERFSFDLSAATDRLPIALQIQILSMLEGSEFAQAWASVLVDRDYHLDYQGSQHVLRYAVGQPMGALSSWGMLALTHHVIVQIAAEKAGIRKLFLDYALLGDDICIASKEVASAYLLIMNSLGVEINLSKSLTSSTGVVEFAKRWRVGETDVSPSSPSLITRLLGNWNYLPTLLLDLVGRGVSTIRDPGILKFRPSSLKPIKESLKFSLIPYFDAGFVKCLLPLDEESKSFSQKDIFALYVHTDRVFNKLALLAFHKAKDADDLNQIKSSEWLRSINDNSKVIIPSIRSFMDNVIIARQFLSVSAAPKRNWLEDKDRHLLATQRNLSFEGWHEYLIETLSALSGIAPTVPDFTIDKNIEKDDSMESRKNFRFMQELVSDIKKWSPGVFKRVTPEPILTEGED